MITLIMETRRKEEKKSHSPWPWEGGKECKGQSDLETYKHINAVPNIWNVPQRATEQFIQYIYKIPLICTGLILPVYVWSFVITDGRSWVILSL